MARDFNNVAHYRTCRSTRASAFAKEHGFTHGIARNINRVEHTIDAGKLVAGGQHGRMHAHANAIVRAVRNCQKLDHIPHFRRSFQVHGFDVADAFRMHIVDGHARMESDGRQNGDFRGGIQTVNVGRGVCLGVTQRLGLGQYVIVSQPLLRHAREHVVRGTVHNAHDRANAVRRKRMLQRIDDRNTAAHTGFERDFHVILLCQRHNFFAIRGHERLVRGNNVLLIAQRRGNQLARGGGAANELNNHINFRVVYHIMEISGEQIPQSVSFRNLCFTRTHTHNLQVKAVKTLEVIVVVRQDVQAAATNCARAHQTDFNCHEKSAFLVNTKGLALYAALLQRQSLPR